jgi:hypothetical protein
MWSAQAVEKPACHALPQANHLRAKYERGAARRQRAIAVALVRRAQKRRLGTYSVGWLNCGSAPSGFAGDLLAMTCNFSRTVLIASGLASLL